MSFRAVLAPIIRVFRWVGLSSFPLSHQESESFWREKSLAFAAITIVNVLVNLLMAIEDISEINFARVSFHARIELYVDLVLTCLLRIHTITVLMESCIKRSIQLSLLTTFDGIEAVFAENLNLPVDNRQLPRFRKFIIISIVQSGLIAVVYIAGVLSQGYWLPMISTMFVLLAFCVISLSNAQWLVFVDAVRFNLERINVCLAKMGDAESQEYMRTVRDIPGLNESENGERIVQLRKCLNGTWKASLLINRCFRWSLFIGIGNQLLVLVINLYWILYSLLHMNIAVINQITFCTSWALVILSHFLLMSLICEDINNNVSKFDIQKSTP